MLDLPTDDEKFQTIIKKNTYFSPNNEFLEKYEKGHIEEISKLLIKLNHDLSNRFDEKIIVDLLRKEKGLESILTLLGISEETLQRIISAIRLSNKPELKELVSLDKWEINGKSKKFSEVSIETIAKKAIKNENVAIGLKNLFLNGQDNTILKEMLPIMELKKFGKGKFDFSIQSLIDTLIRYRVKGSLAAKKENNAELIIEDIFNRHSIKYTRGKLPKIPHNITRTMDFIVPSKDNPELIIEVSKVITTSSGLGDKAKAEIQMQNAIRKNYPKAVFIGFNDGIGWCIREGDLKRMVSGQDYVFTFHTDELERFEDLILEKLSELCYEKKE